MHLAVVEPFDELGKRDVERKLYASGGDCAGAAGTHVLGGVAGQGMLEK
ncbi:MAG: hypothetical protein J0I07_21915 [Myxococcales bacterium]|nr:hypothetical protein [Myxococcales bacterium]